MHREIEGVLGEWIVSLVAKSLLAMVAALVVSDTLLSSYPAAGNLLLMATGLVGVALVAIRIVRRTELVAEWTDRLDRRTIQGVITALPPGPQRSELECHLLAEGWGEDETAVSAMLTDLAALDGDLELRSTAGDLRVPAGARTVVERLLWDGRISGATRQIVAARLLADRVAFVVIDDGRHRELPAALEAITELGLARVDRRYEGGCVASSIEIPLHDHPALPAPVPRPALVGG